MDLHPILVHFPIALLTLYAVLEILPLSRWYRKLPWQALLTVLVICGELGALAALIAGEYAEEKIIDPAMRNIVEVHSTFAYATAIIFGLLAVLRLRTWIRTEHSDFLSAGYPKVVVASDLVSNLLLSAPFRIMLVLAGLAAVTITGALGASMVYGPDIDPFVKFIYGLFF